VSEPPIWTNCDLQVVKSVDLIRRIESPDLIAMTAVHVALTDRDLGEQTGYFSELFGAKVKPINLIGCVNSPDLISL